MVAAITTRLRNTALSLLERYGQSATLRIKSGTTYDVTTGANTPTYTDYQVYAYVGSYNTQAMFNRKLEYRNINERDLRKITCTHIEGDEPAMNDEVLVGSVSYTITSVEKILNVNGDPVAYKLEARR